MREHYPLFRKDNNGVQKLNGRERLPLSLQQWFIFLKAEWLSFVSVITASLYLDEDVILGHQKEWSPYTLPCMPEATVWQPQTETNVNIPHYYCIFFPGNKDLLHWIILTETKMNFWSWENWKHLTFCTLSGKLESQVTVTKWNRSSM